LSLYSFVEPPPTSNAVAPRMNRPGSVAAAPSTVHEALNR
jgi:hypothetical protein